MGYGISPFIKVFQGDSSPSVAPARLLEHCVPKVKIEAVEIGTDRCRGGIFLVQLAVQCKGDAEDVAARVWRYSLGTEVVDGFGVEVAAEALEMTGDQDEVSMVNVKRGVPASGLLPAHGGVGILDLIEGVFRLGLPAMERLRGHKCSPVKVVCNCW